jgi:hypothetical protein
VNVEASHEGLQLSWVVMYKRVFITMRSELNAAIVSGRIKTKQELLDRASALGLTVTRNGHDYIGLLGPDGKRFRIRFQLAGDAQPSSSASQTNANAEPVIRSCGFWIYSLLAHSRDGRRKACYVGQTVNLKRRFREHLTRSCPGRASFSLFEWAAREQVEIRATVISWVDSTQTHALQVEGYWLRLAIAAGFEAPDVQSWGRLPNPANPMGQPGLWPENEILAASRPLAELVEKGVVPSSLFTAKPPSSS